jgi:sugar phosphate isomerase/epimerase
MRFAATLRRQEGESPDALADRAARLGFHAISLGFDHRWTDADLLAIREAFDRESVDIVELGCYCNVLTPRPDEAERNLGRLQRALQAGALLNCDCATTYAGSTHPDPDQPFASYPDNWSDATWERLVQRVWALLDRVEDTGVCLCLEPHPATTLNSLENLVDLVADAATLRLRIALDPAALLTPAAAAESAPALAEVFAALADTIAVARATDLALIEAGSHPHIAPAPLGEGVLDYPTYLKLLAALQLNTPLVVKHQPSDDACARSLAFLEDAAKRACVHPR